jgi:hypothetical protein
MTWKQQSQDNSSDEPLAKRSSKHNSYQKHKTEDNWADFPSYKSCKMRHPKEDKDICWYLHSEKAKPWFNKTRATERLKEFHKKNPGS